MTIIHHVFKYHTCTPLYTSLIYVVYISLNVFMYKIFIFSLCVYSYIKYSGAFFSACTLGHDWTVCMYIHPCEHCRIRTITIITIYAKPTCHVYTYMHVLVY